MNNDAQEAALAVAWDQNRQMNPTAQALLSGLLGVIRAQAARDRIRPRTDAEWTRYECVLLYAIENLAGYTSPEELHRCFMLVAIEASGKRVHIGMEDQL